jgi:hypothetical protein
VAPINLNFPINNNVNAQDLANRIKKVANVEVQEYNRQMLASIGGY